MPLPWAIVGLPVELAIGVDAGLLVEAAGDPAGEPAAVALMDGEPAGLDELVAAVAALVDVVEVEAPAEDDELLLPQAANTSTSGRTSANSNEGSTLLLILRGDHR